MAVDYKGLTIEFKGDATNLSDCLRKIKTSSKGAFDDLNAINKSLRFNPGNTELLEQKIRALKGTIEGTKEKLEAYKKALAELEKKKEENGALTEEEQRQYDQLQRSILTCENQLERYGDQLADTTREAEASKGKMYQFGQAIQDNAEKIAEAGEKVERFGEVTTAAFGAVAASAVAAFEDVDEGADTVIQITGATGEAADALQESFERVGARSAASWGDIGNAVGTVSQRFHLTGQALEDASVVALEFAANTGQDVTSALEEAQMAMTAFNVSGDQLGSVLGLVQTTAQQTGVDVGSLMSAVNQNGAAFREMGLSLEESITLMGNFEAAGIPADQMLGGLKKAATNAAASGIDLGDALTDLAARLQDPATQAEATQEAIDLFGSRAALSFIDAAQSGRLSLDNLSADLSDFAGAVNETYEGTKDAPETFAEAWHEVEPELAELGATILTNLVPMVKQAAEWAGKLTDAWNDMSPEMQSLVGNIVLGGIAFGGLATGIGKGMQTAASIGQTIQNVSMAFSGGAGEATLFTGILGKVKAGASALWGVLMANPMILVVAGIAAVVAGLTWFFTQTETGRKLWAQFTQWMGEKFQAFMNFIEPAIEAVKGFLTGMLEKAQEIGAGIAAFLKGMQQGWESFKAGVGAIIGGFVSGVQGKWAELQSLTASAFQFVKGEVSADLQAAQTAGSQASSALRAAMNGDWSTAASQAQAAFDTIRGRIGEKMAAARELAIGAANAIGERLGFPGLGDKVAGVFNSLISLITSPVQTAKDTLSGIVDRIKGMFNFSWSLPHLNIPHLRLDGGAAPWGFGGKGRLPSMSIDWYAKGGIFDGARLIGIGEAGPEAVLPIDRLSGLMERAMRAIQATGDYGATAQRIAQGVAAGISQSGIAGVVMATIDRVIAAIPDGVQLDRRQFARLVREAMA